MNLRRVFALTFELDECLLLNVLTRTGSFDPAAPNEISNTSVDMRDPNGRSYDQTVGDYIFNGRQELFGTQYGHHATCCNLHRYIYSRSRLVRHECSGS